jgi:hypothetical protein
MNLGPTLVYLLCLLTSATCAALLARSYLRARTPLFLWMALGFGALAFNNLLLVVDMLIVPSVDLTGWRQAANGVAIVVFLYGFLWEIER